MKRIEFHTGTEEKKRGNGGVDMSNLNINAHRLWDSLMETAAFGATPHGGICRFALSEEDRQVRAWFTRQCEAVGCTVQIDSCGNMFATRPGRRQDLPPIAMGSHLDTQPTGGRFDGVLGVLAALEVVRTLAELDYVTHAPLMIVNWTNEEGARFPQAMLGSGVYAGVFSQQTAGAIRDPDGVSFTEALQAISMDGDVAAGAIPFQALFELHIEQGPVLEAEGKTIGVVTGVQGMRWYEVALKGQDCHTGTTPMHLRRDTLLGAARAIAAVQELGVRHAPGVASVGFIEAYPNSRNVIAGRTVFAVDLRHPDEAVLDRMEQDLGDVLASVAGTLRLDLEERRVWRSNAVRFDAGMIGHVRAAVQQAGLTGRDMTSGAGHDAAYIARVVPTTMIFAPSVGGISHNEAEFTSFEHCGTACQVLLNAVLIYDEANSHPTRATNAPVG
jgi:N-carbamoyl-L-amino-acid hydrolase